MGTLQTVVEQDTKKIYHTSTTSDNLKKRYTVTSTEYFFNEKIQTHWAILQKLLQEIIARPTIASNTPNKHIWHYENGYCLCLLCKEQMGQAEDECPGEADDSPNTFKRHLQKILGFGYGKTGIDILDEIERLKTLDSKP